MLETLLTLVVAHVLADFLFQTKWILEDKRDPKRFAMHIAIVAATAWGLSGTWDLRVIALITVTHALADAAKLAWIALGKTDEKKAARDTFYPFLIDQLFHLAVIVAAAIIFPSTVADGWWGGLSADQQRALFQAIAVVGGVVLSVSAGGIVIDKLLAGFGVHRDAARSEATATPAPAVAAAAQANPQTTNPAAPTSLGLPGGGQAIGWLERGLTLLFLLVGQPEGIGLLLAAKSILRFSDANARAHTEYVIIGTLLSFGWGIVTAVLTRAALHHWG